jgi:hypothetical protein
VTRDLDAVLASIDGALADDEFPDAMRWSPEPETVDAPEPYDGDLVWQPEQRYEQAGPILTLPAGYRPARPWTEQANADPLGDLIRATEALRRRGVDPVTRRPTPYRWGGHENARCEVRPVFGGLPVDHLIVDELFLVDPAHRAEVAARREEEARRIVRQLGEWFAGVAEAVSSTVEQIGKAFAAIVPRPEPPRTLRETDPRAYALQLRQSRGTGPDRQVQRQHRPRRHR